MVIQAELSPLNQRELGKLVVSIRANAHHLDLFLAICDDRDLRDLLIQKYEMTLTNEGFTPYRVGLNPKVPSLKTTLDEFVKYNPTLQSEAKGVVTVLGSSSLFGVRLTEDKSEQEKFFFSLQWTREALREFKFPVVIWLSDPVATGLSKQAPDFWSWRSGVFEFEAPQQGVEQSSSPMPSEAYVSRGLEPDELETLDHTVADLKQQIAELHHQNPQSPLLTTLYSELGDAYSQQFAYDYALHAYEQALEQASNSKNQSKQADIFFNLGNTLLNCRRYEQARAYYQQALDIAIETNNRNGQASTYYQLGMVAQELREYEQARTYYQQSLDLEIETNNRNGQASTYYQLGMVAQQLQEYEQALNYYQQALDIDIETNNRNGQASTYHQLGRVAQQLQEYEQAQAYYQLSLDIKIKTNNRNEQASTYHQLGRVAEELREYEQAQAYYQQSLNIKIEANDRDGQSATYYQLGRVAHQLRKYEQARTYYQQALDIEIETNNRNEQAKTYFQLGNIAEELMDMATAKDLYLKVLRITVEVNDHVGLEVSRKNLARFYKEHPDDDWLAKAAQLLNTSLDELKSTIAE